MKKLEVPGKMRWGSESGCYMQANNRGCECKNKVKEVSLSDYRNARPRPAQHMIKKKGHIKFFIHLFLPAVCLRAREKDDNH